MKVLELYRMILATEGHLSQEMPAEYKNLPISLVSKEMVLRHVSYMCEAAISFVQEGRTEKAMRWLGFVQGLLYAVGICTIDDLKEHSRP